MGEAPACNLDTVVHQVIGERAGRFEAGTVAALHVFWIGCCEGVVHRFQSLPFLIPLKQREVCTPHPLLHWRTLSTFTAAHMSFPSAR